MERKVCKRFATTTEAEIEEKRLKSNAKRTTRGSQEPVSFTWLSKKPIGPM